MAAPNSSNALQQWHHLFIEGTKRSRKHGSITTIAAYRTLPTRKRKAEIYAAGRADQ